MMRDRVTSTPLTAREALFFVGFAWFSSRPLALFMISASHVIMDYGVSFRTLCKADVKKTVVASL